jgi:hypothetical protein
MIFHSRESRVAKAAASGVPMGEQFGPLFVRERPFASFTSREDGGALSQFAGKFVLLVAGLLTKADLMLSNGGFPAHEASPLVIEK